MSAADEAAIAAVPYAASVKVGLQFKRRFWEEDERIYGGISYTDLPIARSAIRARGFIGAAGKGVLLGAYVFEGAQRLRIHLAGASRARREGGRVWRQIHPQYSAEFENGVAVAWHRVPCTLGCFGIWTDAGARRALRQSLRDRRPHRAGRRARLLHAGLAGRRDPFLARCDPRLHRRVVTDLMPRKQT